MTTSLIQRQGRRSGRTFRMVLRALVQVSGGQSGTVVAHSADYSYALFNNAMDICKSYLQGGIDYNPLDRSISFPNGCTLTFRGEDEINLGSYINSQVNLICDHYSKWERNHGNR